jgi:hypothetical protein
MQSLSHIASALNPVAATRGADLPAVHRAGPGGRVLALLHEIGEIRPGAEVRVAAKGTAQWSEKSCTTVAPDGHDSFRPLSRIGRIAASKRWDERRVGDAHDKHPGAADLDLHPALSGVPSDWRTSRMIVIALWSRKYDCCLARKSNVALSTGS